MRACTHRTQGRGQGRAVWAVPVPVNESIEGQAIPPAGGEILDVNLRVTGSMEGRDRGRERGRQSGGKKGREKERQRWMDGWVDRRKIDQTINPSIH